jgi:hypothetical protein
MPEDDVKRAVAAHLEAQGYRVTVRWGRDHGIDIEAFGSDGRLIIEAKGEAPKGPQQANYFLNAIGELIQGMADPHARYGLALPDNPQFRGLAGRLPTLARERLQLSVYFVGPDGTVQVD